jgi:hypothetical protein
VRRLAWIFAVLLVIEVSGYVWLSPHVEPHRVYRVDDLERTARGWQVLQGWAAWPVLAAYGAPVLALACIVGWLLAQSLMAEQHQALARRQAAADARIQEAERIRDEGEAIKQEGQTALAQAAKREQEAEAQIKAAEFRLQRSAEAFGGDQHRPAAAGSKAESEGEIGYTGPLLKNPDFILHPESFHGVSF